MNPKQPEKPDNSKSSAEANNQTSASPSTPYTKDMVDKVVTKLSKLGGIEDPTKTWSPPVAEKPRPEFDLTLTEEDEDFSTQPIPSDMLIDSEMEPEQQPKIIESKVSTQEITVSTAVVNVDDEQSLAQRTHRPPWTLQQFFNGEIDLDVELARRFPTMPMMSIIKTRTLGSNSGRKVAELSSQDGAATMIIDADTVSKVIQMSFTFGSMITLKFIMNGLNNMDRDRWLELMRRESGGLAFLWGTQRWSSDYMICIARKHFTNMYAFSPNNFEAGVRLTPKVTTDLLDWLEQIWDEPEPDDKPPQLLTW